MYGAELWSDDGESIPEGVCDDSQSDVEPMSKGVSDYP